MQAAEQHRALNLWRMATVAGVRRDGPDLTARQMAILLTVYLTPPPHTVRGLAESMNISAGGDPGARPPRGAGLPAPQGR